MRDRSRYWLLALLVSFSSPASSAAQCSPPDLGRLIRGYADQAKASKQYFPDTDYVVQNAKPTATLMTQQPLVQWLGLGWEGPVNGMLFALACDGKAIGAEMAGSVEAIGKGPELPGIGETALVDATDGTGTGMVHKTFSIFAIKDGKLTALWRHTSYEHAYIPGSDGDEIEFHVALSDDGIIELSGERRLYREEGQSWSKTPYIVQKLRETYCWDGTKSRYGVCVLDTPKSG